MGKQKIVAKGKKSKKKSRKVKISCLSGSKKKNSLLGKEVRKGTLGHSNNYATRGKVLKKLGLNLKDFRRLCILKGIYPRDPPKKKMGSDKTYYHLKDIRFLSHEPLINQFQELKMFLAKVRNTASNTHLPEARRKYLGSKPTYTLHHLVKERYPRFIDAVRDLDDALCMIHLFAVLPQVQHGSSERMETCRRLAKEWQFWVSKSQCLTKVFVSIKGVYLQAQVLGLPVTWIVPHQFTTAFPHDVDFRIMGTFVEFYQVFLKFVMFKLYNDIDLRYPPIFDTNLENVDGGLLVVKSSSLSNKSMESAVPNDKIEEEKTEKKLSKSEKKELKVTAERIATLDEKIHEIVDMEQANNLENDDEDMELDTLGAELEAAFMTQTEEGSNILKNDDFEDERRKQLFKGLKFFLGREVPRHWMEFIILSFGGKVVWDGLGSNSTVDDSSITHQIVDRPLEHIKENVHVNRELIQPQWVLDSINARIRLPVERYKPGVSLPPHLSPFVEDDTEGYVPAYREELNSLKAASKETAFKSLLSVSGVSKSEDDTSSIEEVDGADDAYGKEIELEAKGISYASKKDPQVEQELNDASSSESESSEKSADEKSENNDQESESEKSSQETEDKVEHIEDGTPKQILKPPTEKEEMHELSKIMMSNKAKRLYGKMQHGIGKRRNEIERLKEKRRAIESKYSKATPSKKKAKRS